MDPLSGLAVACAVTQFVDFGAKVLSKGYEISKSLDGATESNADVVAITSDIENLSERISKSLSLHPSSRPASNNDVALTKMCQGCQDIAAILLARLNTLKARKDGGNWELFSKAFLSAWSEKEIKEMRDKLERYRRQLDSHILVDLRESCAKSDLMNSESFKSLDQVTRDGIDSILKGQSTLTSNQELQTSIITGSIRQEGVKTRLAFWDAVQNRAEDRSRSQLMTNSMADAQDKFLATLRYEVMNDRYTQIKDSHEKTFEWIFREPKTTTRPWNNFSSWLQQSDQSIYWINGKAGSGKSTLMAFLLNHDSTGALLTHWSKDIPLLTGSFFFWNSGSPLQRTQNGMLRSLLHETLSQNASLIPVVAPDYHLKEKRYWNDRALKQTFQKLCTQVTVPINLFLLIDGLDEYEGDHSEIAVFFKEFSQLPNLKICVSSRPLPVFDLAFESSPSLKLENLTFDDIQIYVHDRLLNNPVLAQMHREDEKDVEVLIDSVASRAQGVFLWVVLVCTSLTNGLVAADRLSDLQKRVDACPKKLEELYAYMLQRIEPQYKDHSSRLFRIVDAASWGYRQLSARHLRFADMSLSTVMATKVKSLDPNKILPELKSLELCLKTRCAGLVELVDTPPAGHTYSTRITLAPDELVHVEYIHRSAREYLSEAEPQHLSGAEEGNKAFDPYLALASSALMEIKTLDPRREQDICFIMPSYSSQTEGVLNKVGKALTYASKTTTNSLSSMVALVDEIDSVMAIHWKCWLKKTLQDDENADGDHQYSDYFDPYEFLPAYIQDQQIPKTPDPESSMVTLSARFGLLSYAKKKIEDDPKGTIFKSGRPLLDYAARPAFHFFNHEEFNNASSFNPFLDMIVFLLEKGCDPNETWHGRSPWETLLLMADYHYGTISTNGPMENVITPDYLESWLQIFRVFIDHGASGKAQCLSKVRVGKRRSEVHKIDAPTMIHNFVENLPTFITYEKGDEGIVIMTKVDAEVKDLLELLAKNDGSTNGSKATADKIENNGTASSIATTPATHQAASPKPKRASRFCGCFR